MEHDVILLEQQSLEALRHNYPQLQQLEGSLTFVAEAESTILTATAWHFSEQANALLKQSGLKTAILDMLDSLVAQRKQQRIRPNRGGRLVVNAGQFGIEWLAEGNSSISLYKQTG